MMDLTEKGSGSEEGKKTCVDCNTTKTPLWRGGPAGPKTLCNACGIKHRKKRRAMMSMNKGGSQEKTKKEIVITPAATTTSTSTSTPTATANQIQSTGSHHRKSKEKSKMDVALKLRLLTLGRQVLLRRSAMEKQRKFKLCEEEEAAILLMALSCGSIY